MQMSIETQQEEQRRIEDEIVDNWNYEDAEAIIDLADVTEEYLEEDA